MHKIFLKKWIALFIITLFSLIIGLKNASAFYYLFFWFLLSLIVLGLLWVLAEYFTAVLYLTRKTTVKVEEDDSLEINLEVRNNGFLPLFNLVIMDNLSCAEPKLRKPIMLIGFIGARSSVNIKYNCVCYLRGRYDLGPAQVYFFDPLGLFFLKKTFPALSELYVYPRSFNVRKFPHLTKGAVPWFGIETSRVSGDDDEFFGVREYKDGDPIKRIHWFSSARKDHLIVKQYQRQSFYRATILFNLDKDSNFGDGKESVAEYIIKIVASLTRYLINMGVSIELIAHAEEIVHIPFNKGQEHLEDIYKFLAIAQPESRVSLGEVFENFSAYISDDSTLITIMADKDMVYLPAMLSLRVRNVSLIPVILVSSTFLPKSNKGDDILSAESKISNESNLNPIYVCQGEHWTEKF